MTALPQLPTAEGVPALIGRYESPDVREGDRVYCRFRKAWCRVTGWGTGPIRWPRVQQIGVRGRPGLLVNAALERAVCTESAVALMHWFGLSAKPVSWWRRAFGVDGHNRTPGSRACHRKPVPARVMVGAESATRPGVGRWPRADLARLGTDTDEAVAAALGRSVSAVIRQRSRRAVPPFDAPPVRLWTPNEVALLGTGTDEAVAAALGRTVIAVASKRTALRIPPFVPPAELAGHSRTHRPAPSRARTTSTV